MQLVSHGGNCCGIKTIYGFMPSPETDIGPLEKFGHSDGDADGTMQPLTRFFHESAPKESGLKRLKRYIDYLSERRPDGLLEIALVEKVRYRVPTSGPFWHAQEEWFPVVEKLGFKMVSRFCNSNSGNVVRVYHLRFGEEPPLTFDELVAQAPKEKKKKSAFPPRG